MNLELIHWIIDRITGIVLIIMVGFICLFFYKSLFWTPGDDLTTFAKDVNCHNNTCEITFLYNVSSYWQAASTGSDVPVVGGNDWVICLNGTEIVRDGNLRVGDMVATAYLHFIDGMQDGWVTTRGSNNFWDDAYKFPIQSVSCVVGGVLR